MNPAPGIDASSGALPLLVRALLEQLLWEEANIEAEVSADGAIFDVGLDQPLPATEGYAEILVDCCIQLDNELARLTGCPAASGLEVVCRFLGLLGREDAERLYHAREVLLTYGPPWYVAKRALRRCAGMITAAARARNRRGR
jgi:hypothetical protein